MAFFAPGPMEMLILGIMCLGFLAVVVVVVVVVVMAGRQNRGGVVPCPHCSAPTPPWAEFCPNCGRPMKHPPP